MEELARKQGGESHDDVAVGELGRFIQSEEDLVGLHGVFMVVRVPLELKEQIVGETMGRVPAVQNGNLLVGAILQLLPTKPIMLNIVDYF